MILPGVGEIWRRSLPDFEHELDVLLCRVITTLAKRWVLEIRGESHVRPERDPFILALNHSQWPEAVLLPTVLIFLRGGRWIHFIADWNFLLIPGVGLAFHRRVLGFRPVATHEHGEIDVTYRRITLLLDLAEAYDRFRQKNTFIHRFIVNGLPVGGFGRPA